MKIRSLTLLSVLLLPAPATANAISDDAYPETAAEALAYYEADPETWIDRVRDSRSESCLSHNRDQEF